MPSRDRVMGLIALVEQGKFVEAIEQYYTEDASMQENGQPPRVGRDLLVETERGLMARFVEMNSAPVGPVFIEDDHVVIRWQFDFTLAGGKKLHLDEIAYQRWRDDRVCQERFFYDPSWLAG